MNFDLSRREILHAVRATPLSPATTSVATGQGAMRPEGRSTPTSCLGAGAGKISAGNLKEARLRRIKRDHARMRRPQIPFSKLILCSLVFSGLALAAERGEEVRLWPREAPGSEGETAPEVFQASENPKLPGRFTVVHYPSIYVFLPTKEKANGTGMVIAPGGGHSQLVIDKEGYEIADWLNANGIAGFVVKYRLARAKGSHYTVQGDALADAARAMRTVRNRAKEWGVDPARIGFMGYSAGGEVAALIETRFDAGNDSSTDPIERVSSRPDLAVVVYPGFRPGTITVPKDAPPTFLVCADDDRSHVVTTVNLYLDLEKQGVSSEMHIYASGGHGFGMRHSVLPVAAWPDRLKEWMVDRKLLKP